MTSPSTTPVLELTGVRHSYPGDRPIEILHGIDLRVDAGEFVAVVGPSGSGKSTLLALMGILDLATAGTVRLDGHDVAALDEATLSRIRAERIGFVFQQFFLLPGLTAVENVATGLLYAGVARAERGRLAREALEHVGLGHRLDHRPGQLSGGEQQRVALARAVLGRPRVLFADEPTGALDQSSGRVVVDLLRQIAEDGTAVVLITHDQELAAALPRRVSIVDGRIVADDHRGELCSLD